MRYRSSSRLHEELFSTELIAAAMKKREGIISEINQSDMKRQGPWERVSLKLSINSKTTQLG